MLSDAGDIVLVSERLSDTVVGREEWRKADWTQFCHAIRGKLASYVLGMWGSGSTEEKNNIKGSVKEEESVIISPSVLV